MPAPRSPLSKTSKTIRRYALAQDWLIAALESYFASPAPKDAAICGYEIWECQETGLLFAEPPVPGNEAFYRWIASYEGYYPAQRWEYQQTVDRLPKKPLRIADVGCGDGKFLRLVVDQRQADVLGIDTLPAAVERCGKNGIAARCGFIADVIKADPSLRHSFDYVTAFHCLEHVPDPLSFIEELRELLKPDGVLCISTPLSPMPFEAVWFDPQNHPPHHMTRWNSLAYRRLAERFDLELELHYSKPAGFIESLRHAMRYRIAGGPYQRISRRFLGRIALEILISPVTLSRYAFAWLRAEVPGASGVLVFLQATSAKLAPATPSPSNT